MILSQKEITAFQKVVWDFYKKNGRDLPWRRNHIPYRVLVSEMMLQQTQVERVLAKYEHFLKIFPHWQALARSSPKRILKVWQGLGYNRRALALQKIALTLQKNSFRIPEKEEELLKLPGVGVGTARAFLAFAYNRPVVFLETNIRRVLIHHFYPHRKKIEDRELLVILEKVLPRDRSREWYSALMDYGSWLSKNTPNPNRRSKTYRRATPFSGSVREVRGQVLKLLLEKPRSALELKKKYQDREGQLQTSLLGLEQDGFIIKTKNSYRLRT